MAKNELPNAAPFSRSIGEIKAKINWEAYARNTPSHVLRSVLIRVIRGRDFPRKINAAQASHPGRMLVDVSFALSLPNAVRRLRETAFARNARFSARALQVFDSRT